MKSKKGLGAVIATSLLIVVAVITLVIFNSWFQSYSSNLMADVETQSSINAVPEIETVIGDFVYIKTSSNLTIDRILVDGNECETNISLGSGMQGVNISSCLDSLSSSTPKITLITDKNIVTTSVYLKDAVVGSGLDSTPTIVETDGNFNLLSNGIVTCNGASVGETGTLDAVTYTAVSNQNLSSMIGSNNISFYETACTSLVIDMNVDDLWNTGVFYGLTINPDISHWDTSSVTDMTYMFGYTEDFNTDISGWDVSSVIDMNNMFAGAISFDQPLNNWNVSSVTNMSGMFYTASSFNQDLNNWDVSSVTDMSRMFSEFNPDEGNFNGNISSWNVSNVVNMSYMFAQPINFNQSLNNWDVSSVTDMDSMFYIASNFSQNLSSWCVSLIPPTPNGFDIFSGFEGQTAIQPQWGQPCP